MDHVTHEELREVIREVLNIDDIRVVTKKSIRKFLSYHFGPRLHIKSRKREIKQIALECIAELKRLWILEKQVTAFFTNSGRYIIYIYTI